MKLWWGTVDKYGDKGIKWGKSPDFVMSIANYKIVDPAHKFMKMLRNKKQIVANINNRVVCGRRFKFMCGVLNFVVKFSSPRLSSLKI